MWLSVHTMLALRYKKKGAAMRPRKNNWALAQLRFVPMNVAIATSAPTTIKIWYAYESRSTISVSLKFWSTSSLVLENFRACRPAVKRTKAMPWFFFVWPVHAGQVVINVANMGEPPNSSGGALCGSTANHNKMVIVIFQPQHVGIPLFGWG